MNEAKYYVFEAQGYWCELEAIRKDGVQDISNKELSDIVAIDNDYDSLTAELYY